jgi:hypothetical protein
MAASINDGYGSTTFLLERFGSAARNSKLHRAGTQWGQWWDSVYLCDYAAQPPSSAQREPDLGPRGIQRGLRKRAKWYGIDRQVHDFVEIQTP